MLNFELSCFKMHLSILSINTSAILQFFASSVASYQNFNPSCATGSSVAQSGPRKSMVRLNRIEHVVAGDCSMLEPKLKCADSDHALLFQLKYSTYRIRWASYAALVLNHHPVLYCFIWSSNRASELYFCLASELGLDLICS